MLLRREFFGFPIIFAIFGFIHINDATSSKTHDLLSRILKSNTKPLVVYLKDHYHTHHHDKKREKISLFWLDYLIRATENDSPEDPVEMALRSTSCGVTSSCAKKCPTHHRKPCVNACSQVFDENNECAPAPDKCTSDGICGRTLPPYWRW